MRCFILGNSGELLDHDLSLLKGETVFAANSFALRMPEIITHYLCADIIMGFLPEVRSRILPGTHKYYSRIVWNTIDEEEGVEVFDTIDNSTGFNFSSSLVYLCETVTYAALQMAASMGYDEIYLLGVDFGLPANGINYIPEQKEMMDILKSKNLRNPTIDKSQVQLTYEQQAQKMNHRFIYAKSILEKNGISVYNLSKAGNLKVFTRRSFTDVINGNHEAGIVPDVELSN